MELYCSNHVEKDAAGMCVRCGKPFCEDCLVEVDGKMHCKSCVNEIIEYQREQANHHHTPSVDVIPRKSRFVALLLCFFLGSLGVHRFYIGDYKLGLAYAAITLLLGWTKIALVFMLAVDIVDLYFIASGKILDAHDRPLM